MKIVKSLSLFFASLILFIFYSTSSFAQMDKTSCQEILGNLDIKEFRQISR